jgi:hypothetical protein
MDQTRPIKLDPEGWSRIDISIRSSLIDLIYKSLEGLLELRWHWIANDTKIRIGRTAVTPLQ